MERKDIPTLKIHQSHFLSRKCLGNVQLKLNNTFTEQIVHLRYWETLEEYRDRWGVKSLLRNVQSSLLGLLAKIKCGNIQSTNQIESHCRAKEMAQLLKARTQPKAIAKGKFRDLYKILNTEEAPCITVGLLEDV